MQAIILAAGMGKRLGDLAKHSSQGDNHRQEAEGASHPFFHRRCDFIERHTGKKASPHGHHHQSQESVHTRLHD